MNQPLAPSPQDASVSGAQRQPMAWNSPNARGTKLHELLHGGFSDEQASRLTAAHLATGASASAVRWDGRTALHLACVRGYPATARALMEGGADANARAEGGETPLMDCAISMRGACAKTIQALLSAGADPAVADANGISPLTVLELKSMGEGDGELTDCWRAMLAWTEARELELSARPGSMKNKGAGL